MSETNQSLPVNQNMASPMSNGALSPQQMQVASPQSNLGSPINVANTTSVSMPYCGATMQAQAVSDIHGQSVTQPVQVSSLSADHLEQDFANPDMFNQYQGFENYAEVNMYNQQPNYQPLGQQSCAFQARGSDRDLQDVLDIIQEQGYDEVDARLDQPMAKPFGETFSMAVPTTEKMICRGSGQPESMPVFSEEPAVRYSAKIQKDYNKTSQKEMMQKVVSQETKSIQTRDSGGRSSFINLTVLVLTYVSFHRI